MKKFICLSLFALVFLLNPSAHAVWIDSKTGEPVQVEPYIDPIKGLRNYDYQEGHATYHGKNLFWDKECKTWKDAATGEEVLVEPYVDPINGVRNYDYQEGHTTYHGKNLNWVPCPGKKPSSTTNEVKTAAAPAAKANDLFQLSLGYNFMRTAQEDVKNLNGFQVAGFYNVNSWLAVGGEFSGLYGTETETRQFMVGDMKKDFDVKTSLDRYFYLFGPQMTWHPCEHTRVFGHVLVGGVHDRNEVSFPDGSMRSSADAFALAVGVGVDVQVTRHFSVGPSFDYVPTHFTSPTGNNWQNNWRAGVSMKFSF